MIENGSDVHQGGDGPLMRAALSSHRIPMMELLVSHGANVNADGTTIIQSFSRRVRPSIPSRSNGCWITAQTPTATGQAESIEARRWSTSSDLMCGHPGSVLVSIYSSKPAASANTMLSCWMHSVGIWTVWLHISTRTLQSHTAVSLDWISAPRVDVCSRSAAPRFYMLPRNM